MHTDVSNIKINLTLDILNLRNDGYHNIDSLFLEVDYGDKISFDPTSAFPIKVKGFDVPEDDSNLVCRAHALFCEHFGIKREGGFHLCKKIPPGSGFGSGSSNAWSVFRILSNFYGLKIDNDDLQRIATKIGSDVFYFSQGGACRVSAWVKTLKRFKLKMKVCKLYLALLMNLSLHLMHMDGGIFQVSKAATAPIHSFPILQFLN